MVALLRQPSPAADAAAISLVSRIGTDADALAVLLASMVGAFVTLARRRSGAGVDMAIADQMSLAVEVMHDLADLDERVMSTILSRVVARHRRLRRHDRFEGGADLLLTAMASTGSDLSDGVIARIEVDRVLDQVRELAPEQAQTWRHLVELRVLETSSEVLAERDGITPAALRKRCQRLADSLRTVAA
jgi:hypothetical protein